MGKNFASIIIMSLLSQCLTPALANDNCVDDAITELLRVDSTTSASDIERYSEIALGRQINAEETKAIGEAVKIGNPDMLTKAELEAQNAILAKHFDKSEIKRLRRFGIVSNSLEATPGAVPSVAKVYEAKLSDVSGKHLGEVRAGKGKKEYRYFIDLDDQIHIIEGETKLGNDGLMIVKDGEGNSYVVKETGTIKQNPKTKNPELTSDHVAEHSGSSSDDVLAKLKKENPDLEINRPSMPSRARNKAMDCMEIMASQLSGKSFFLDRMLVGTGFAAGSIVVTNAGQAALGHEPSLATKHGQEVAVADLSTNVLGTFVGTGIGAGLFKVEAGHVTSLVVRGASSYAMADLQKPVYNAIVTPEPKKDGAPAEPSTADKIARFDKVHTLARIPINYGVDWFIQKKLPLMLFDACRKGAKLSVWTSPKMIRIYERGISTVIYRGARMAIEGE